MARKKSQAQESRNIFLVPKSSSEAGGIETGVADILMLLLGGAGNVSMEAPNLGWVPGGVEECCSGSRDGW